MKCDNSRLLRDSLVRYVFPFLNKNNAKKRKQSRLEETVNREKAKLKPLELVFLEDLVNSFLADKKTGMSDKIKTQNISLLGDSGDGKDLLMQFAAERKKEDKGKLPYSVSIKYEQNEGKEELSIKIKLGSSSKNEKSEKVNGLEEDKKEYSFVIAKENKAKDSYSLSLVYENNYEQERLSVTYKSTIGTYLNRRQEAINDFTDRVPGKHMHILPESLMGGILGFTYLGENFMARRADLTGETAKMVDIHESIHTPNEYETRVLTSWIMAKERLKYIK
ncbi:hypothetical protein KY347_00705 [Candidatus Woesearchaeota archaeon]|nr:hypothetical protein [Candidatus Woesearchaeota archaeon]